MDSCNFLEHIKECKNCKEQFLNIMGESTNMEFFSNSDNNNNNNNNNNNKINIFGYKYNLSIILKIIFILLILIIFYLIFTMFTIKNNMNQKYLQKYLHNNLYMIPESTNLQNHIFPNNIVSNNKLFKLIQYS